MQAGIQHRQRAGIFVEHRRFVERRLAFRHLAAPVDRERLVEPLQQIGTAFRHDIVQRHRTDDRRQPARLRPPQAQQRDDVAAIDMEVLPFRGRIAAHRRIGRTAAAEIIDMAEQMPLRVLRTGTAEIRADTPIGGRALDDRPVLDRHAAQQHEAAPVEHLVAKLFEHRSERRQRKVVAADVGDVEAAGAHRLQCGFDLGDVRWRQAVGSTRTRARASPRRSRRRGLRSGRRAGAGRAGSMTSASVADIGMFLLCWRFGRVPPRRRPGERSIPQARRAVQTPAATLSWREGHARSPLADSRLALDEIPAARGPAPRGPVAPYPCPRASCHCEERSDEQPRVTSVPRLVTQGLLVATLLASNKALPLPLREGGWGEGSSGTYPSPNPLPQGEGECLSYA